ncbi:MAG: M13 family metallopeptidase, partial [Deltaproteobacteria bacterium]|nr:M13 family metallopeptidase [Deltaproteobacteria bacterium]
PAPAPAAAPAPAPAPTPPPAPATPAAPAAPPLRPLTALPYTPSLDVTAMNRSVDPCVDFYQYSCGGWIENNPIPPDQPSWMVYSKLTVENLRFLWGILEEAARPRPDRTPAQQKIGDLFAACRDEAAVERQGLAPLQADLDAITALRSKRDLAPLVARLQLTTGGYFHGGMLFPFGADIDYADSTQQIAFALAGGLGLPDRDYYVKPDARSQEIRRQYVAHVQRMLQLLGDPPAAARAARAVMAIETDLARASLTRVDKRDPRRLFHRLQRAEVQALTPSFDWDAFLQASGVPTVAVINVTEPAFFRQLEVALRTVPLADWQAYLRWHLVHAMAPYLSRAFVNEDFAFRQRTLRGVPQLAPRWRRCVQYVDELVGEALGQEFVRRTFTPDTKRRALELVHHVERAMAREIKQLPWMGPQTKQAALAKLHAIANKIGYPDRWRDYGALDVRPGDFHGDVRRALAFESRRWLAKIGKPVDRGEWYMTPPSVNAYYDPQRNDMNFPAGVLQPPLFDVKLDDAPNYGNTGSTIGHELTHGFDDEGRQFDARGNLREWWTREDAAAFNRQAQCIADQYAQYVIVDDIKINSRLTLGEDIADLGGTRLAWMAWKAATTGRRLEPADGLTPEQRFFVGVAQWACGEERPEAARVRAITSPHSPYRYRINGVMVNLPEFGRAFRCRAGQPMVKAKPCRVW